jgi:hypothetical protein
MSTNAQIAIPPNLPPSRPFRSIELLAARVCADRRRAAAMVLQWHTVAGQRLRLITPASYSRMVAIGNAFPWRAPPTPADVRDFVWFHAPGFTSDPAEAERRRAGVMRRLERAIAPPWLRWRHSRKSWTIFTTAAWATVGARIAEIVEETFADALPGGESDSRCAASFEAQMIDLFSARYRWDPDRTRQTPVCQLLQFMRSADGVDFDATEARLLAAALRDLNPLK